MSTPQLTGAPAPIGTDPLTALMTSGYRWILGADRGIDWSISDGLTGEVWSNPQEIIARVREALDFVSSVADVRFNFLGTYSIPVQASLQGSEINLAVDNAQWVFTEDEFYAIGFGPRQSAGGFFEGAPGDVLLNQRSGATLFSFATGAEGGALLLHELGHTLGLKHPHDDGGTGRPTFEDASVEYYDSTFHTVMSYDNFSGNPLAEHPSTFMALDVVALQALYGVNRTTNLGDSTYQIAADRRLYTLWDAGGTDTLSFAAATKGFYVEIPWLAFSSVLDTRAGHATPVDDTDPTWIGLTGEYEVVIGSSFDDEIIGNEDGNTLLGGAGNDYLDGEHGKNQLRGGAGDDELLGGDDFDDLHGNVGNDTVEGFSFDDWVVGGQGNDLLFGGDGGDLCYGQLGSDTVDGGAGADAVVGGQANDSLVGGAGDDFITGDRGDDTVTGGTGADTFQTSNVTGLDRVTDFSQAEGDRVLVVAGTYTLRQDAADTVIDFGGGHQMVLAGVTLTSLTSGWISG